MRPRRYVVLTPPRSILPRFFNNCTVNHWVRTLLQWLQFNCGNIVTDPMVKCGNASTFSPPHYGKVVGVELYSHDGDNANSFGDYENENLALRACELT